MQLGNGFDIFTQFLGFNLYDKYTMTSCTLIVLWGLAHHSICITDEKQVEGILFVLSTVDGEALEDELAVCVLEEADALQIKQVFG